MPVGQAWDTRPGLSHDTIHNRPIPVTRTWEVGAVSSNETMRMDSYTLNTWNFEAKEMSRWTLKWS